jgi:sodium pump decarboxylase gamma subunit
MVENQTNITDEYGNRHAWIELYNTTRKSMQISTVFITNERVPEGQTPDKTKMYVIPLNDKNTKIEHLQQAVFFADGDPWKGTFHASFELVPGQENYIAIYDADGLTKLDEVVVPANLPADQSFARTVEIAQWDKIDSNDFNPAEWEFRNGTEKDSAITPGVNNQVIELNDKIEKFQRLDGTGVMLTVMAMLIVFSALILLSVCFYIFGKINAGIARKNKAVSQGKPEDADHSEVEEDSGEVIAAISTALYQHLNAHDYEETVLTINKVKRAYSPWSSKIYSLRELPKKN